MSLRCIVGLHAWITRTIDTMTGVRGQRCERCHRTRVTHPR